MCELLDAGETAVIIAHEANEAAHMSDDAGSTTDRRGSGDPAADEMLPEPTKNIAHPPVTSPAQAFRALGGVAVANRAGRVGGQPGPP